MHKSAMLAKAAGPTMQPVLAELQVPIGGHVVPIDIHQMVMLCCSGTLNNQRRQAARPTGVRDIVSWTVVGKCVHRCGGGGWLASSGME